MLTSEFHSTVWGEVCSACTHQGVSELATGRRTVHSSSGVSVKPLLKPMTNLPWFLRRSSHWSEMGWGLGLKGEGFARLNAKSLECQQVTASAAADPNQCMCLDSRVADGPLEVRDSAYGLCFKQRHQPQRM